MRYGTILADPPWMFDNYGCRGHGAARNTYGKGSAEGNLLTDEAIAAMPVAGIAEDDAALVCWVTAPVLAEGRHVPVMKAWGFEPKTILKVWVKTYPDGAAYMGLGRYTRSGTEAAVLGIRGSFPRDPKATRVRQVITCPLRTAEVGEDGELDTHSVKPDIHGDLETLWPRARRVELFARRRVPGWDAWGAEAPRCDYVFGPTVGPLWRWEPADAR